MLFRLHLLFGLFPSVALLEILKMLAYFELGIFGFLYLATIILIIIILFIICVVAVVIFGVFGILFGPYIIIVAVTELHLLLLVWLVHHVVEPSTVVNEE